MQKRSRHEVSLTAAMVTSLNRLDDDASLAALAEALITGDNTVLADAVLELPDLPTNIILEFDGAHWHGPEKVDGDVRKTLKLLAKNPTGIILRVRQDGCPPLQQALHDAGADIKRVVIVELDKEASSPHKVHLAMRVVANRLRPALELLGSGPKLATYLARLDATTLWDAADHAKVQLLVTRAWAASDAAWAANYHELVAVLGSEGAAKEVLEHVTGVNIRLGDVVLGLRTLRDEFGVPAADLKTLLSNSLVVRLDNPAFNDGLRNFMHDLEVAPADLKTILSNSLVVRLDNPAFVASLRAFMHEFGVPAADLKTILSDSLATRLESPAFVASLRAFMHDLGVPAADLKTLLNGSLAARLEDPKLVDQVRAFMDTTGIKRGDLVTVLSHGSLVARLHKPAFHGAVHDLVAELGVKPHELKNLLTGSFASRIEKPATVAFVRWLRFELKLPAASLPSLSDGFWATDTACAKQVMMLLTKTYGVQPCDLPKRGPFWQAFRPGKVTFGSMKAALAECPSVATVNKKLKSMGAPACARRTAVH
jgi:antitoxin component HigA of HigAB toxin-antitoxin module